jgi:hypothetical protein
MPAVTAPTFHLLRLQRQLEANTKRSAEQDALFEELNALHGTLDTIDPTFLTGPPGNVCGACGRAF